jgi:hypothetical protein
VYIASCGHSGSTLLDSMIAAHPDAFSVGEVVFLDLYAHMRKVKNEVTKFGNECTCGVDTIWQCPFWTEVERAITSDAGMSLRDIDLQHTEDVDVYREQNVALFEAVAKVSGASVIVDSSKAPRRLARLIATRVFDIVPVHLIRSPKGMVYSHIKKNITGKHYSTTRQALQFPKRTLEIRSILRGMDYPTVRYERFVRNPEAHLRAIMPYAGLEFDPAQLEWASTEKHNLGGNTMRRASSSEIRYDEKWKKGLSAGQKLLIDAIALPGKLAVMGRSVA